MSAYSYALSSASRRLLSSTVSASSRNQCLLLLRTHTTASVRCLQTVTPHRPDSLEFPSQQPPRNKNAPRSELLGNKSAGQYSPYGLPTAKPSSASSAQQQQTQTTSSSFSTTSSTTTTSSQATVATPSPISAATTSTPSATAATATSPSSKSSTTTSSPSRTSKLRPRKAAITLTPVAVDHLRDLLSQPDPKLIRIGVKNRGCSGLAYHLEYVDKPGRFDEEVVQDGVKVLIDSKALFSIIGSEMDWSEDKLSARFVFKNPNIKEQCGCGESFMV